MRQPSFERLGVAFAVLLVLAAPAAAQPAYTYTVIADVSNCFNVGSPVINSSGQVAFGAHCSNIVIQRGSGGPLTTIFTASAAGTPLSDVISMNDSGRVAFGVNNGCGTGGAGAILAGDGGAASPVVDVCAQPQFRVVARPSINNSGAVAFMADSTDDGIASYNTVFLATGGSFVTIAGPGSSSSAGPLTHAIEPAVNNTGVVTFLGQGATQPGLFAGTGGPLSEISIGRGESVFNGINDAGRVAFVGQESGNLAILTGDGGPISLYVSRSASGYIQFTGGGAAINNHGIVAFMATTASGASGIFTGSDPDTDAVVRSGDVIAGLGTVFAVSASEEAINDLGQVAFVLFYDLPDGTRKKAIIRADPAGANLTVGALKAPKGAAAGSAIDIKDTTRNTGTAAAGSSTTRFWLSANKTLGGDTELGSRRVPALAAGGQHTASTSVAIPDVAPGSYFLLAQADADDDVTESAEADNVKAKAIVIGPDLAIKSVALNPSSPTSSSPTTVTVTITNAGGGLAGDTVTRLYRSSNGKLDATDAMLAEAPLAPVAAGTSGVQPIAVTLPAGSYYLLVAVDAGGAVAEANEKNNLKKVQLVVP